MLLRARTSYATPMAGVLFLSFAAATTAAFLVSTHRGINLIGITDRQLYKTGMGTVVGM